MLECLPVCAPVEEPATAPRRHSSAFLAAVFLLIFALASSRTLRNSPAQLPTAVFSLSLLFAAAAFIRPVLLWPLFAVSCMFFPLCGSGALNLAAAALLLAAALRRPLDFCPPRSSSGRAYCLAVLTLAVLALCGAVFRLAAGSDFANLAAVYEAGGPRGLAGYFAAAAPQWLPLLVDSGGYFLALLLAVVFCNQSAGGSPLRRLLDALAWSAVGVVFVLAAQLRDSHPILTMNQSAFWRMVGRYSASFTDPNAFGLVAAAVVPALWLLAPPCNKLRRRCYRAAAVLLTVAAAWSGSRSFWAGLVICCAAFPLFYRAKRFVRKAGGSRSAAGRSAFAAFCAAIVVLAAAAAAGHPAINAKFVQTLELAGSPPGPVRILHAINWDNAAGVFSDRLLFARLAAAVWQQHPLFGVGAGGFYQQQALAAEALSAELGAWRDNANNYYLQILAEQGLAGFSLLLAAFFFVGAALRNADRELPVLHARAPGEFVDAGTRIAFSRALALAAALLLLIGPHLFFEEFRYLLVVLLAAGAAAGAAHGQTAGLAPASRKPVFALVLVVLLFALAGMRATDSMTTGIYAVEGDGAQRHVWTKKRARLLLCRQPETVELELRAARPGVAERPLRVSFPAGTGQTVTLSDQQWVRSPVLATPAGPGTSEIRLEVSELWSPGRNQPGGDDRWLGVMLRPPEGLVESEGHCRFRRQAQAAT